MGWVCSWCGDSVTATATSGCPPKRQINSFASDLVSAWSGLYPKWHKYLSCFQVAGPSAQSIKRCAKSVSAVTEVVYKSARATLQGVSSPNPHMRVGRSPHRLVGFDAEA